MKRSILFAAAALCLGAVAPVLAQAPTPAPVHGDPLPEGPGKDVVVRVCTACHDATQFAFARYTPDEWNTEISKMQGAGAEITAEDQVVIAAYLARNFAKPAPAAP
jgi:cytochrome c5